MYGVARPESFQEVAAAKYLLLTTFTKDGRPKPTPVWVVRDGDNLRVITQEQSWKVKRIRNTPRVTIAKCDMRGNPKSEAAEATAVILDKSRNGEVYDALGKRYGLLGKTVNFVSKVRGGMPKNVAIEIRAVS